MNKRALDPARISFARSSLNYPEPAQIVEQRLDKKHPLTRLKGLGAIPPNWNGKSTIYG